MVKLLPIPWILIEIQTGLMWNLLKTFIISLVTSESVHCTPVIATHRDHSTSNFI